MIFGLRHCKPRPENPQESPRIPLAGCGLVGSAFPLTDRRRVERVPRHLLPVPEVPGLPEMWGLDLRLGEPVLKLHALARQGLFWRHPGKAA